MVTISKKLLAVSLLAFFGLVLVGCKHTPSSSLNETGSVVVVETGADDVDDSDLVADVTFDVVGENFAYDLETIEVNEGDVVTINFMSKDGFHDWVVDEFDAATEQVNPGTPTSVTFVADQAGTFEFYCSVGKHRDMGMVGELIVNPSDDSDDDDDSDDSDDDDSEGDDDDMGTGDAE